MASRIIILLSDIHVGRGPGELERMRRLVSFIGSRRPGLPVLITGDLTDSGTLGQFTLARAELDRLAATNPVLTVPGNHDYGWKGNFFNEDSWNNWVKVLSQPLGWPKPPVPWMGPAFEPKGLEGLGVWEDGPVVYLGIDSGDPEDKEVSARGYISQNLATALAALLDKYKNKTRVALLHHHPFTEGLFTALHGSERLLAAVGNRCEVLLFGHEHAYGLWRDSYGVPLIVSSHKSTNLFSGEHMAVTMIEISNAGTAGAAFRHWLEVV